MDILKHEFRSNVVSVETNIYGRKVKIGQDQKAVVEDVVDEVEVVELYTDMAYVALDKCDVEALAKHFGLL